MAVDTSLSRSESPAALKHGNNTRTTSRRKSWCPGDVIRQRGISLLTYKYVRSLPIDRPAADVKVFPQSSPFQ